MIMCPFCQGQNADGVAYCARCGQALAGVPGSFAPTLARKTGLAVASLVLGILGLPMVMCFGMGFVLALVGATLGTVALVKASQRPQEYGGKGMAIAGLAASGLTLLITLPIVAAIAIPSFMRARLSANESAAIGDIRTVFSAQTAYMSSNGGFCEGALSCLAKNGGCIPNAPAGAPTFLEPTLASLADRNGYKRALHLGPPASGDTSMVSPSSVSGYAYVAVPVDKGKTGVRGFCGDASGRICSTSDGSEPAVSGGQCADPCTAVN